jgi:hypothetical protein
MSNRTSFALLALLSLAGVLVTTSLLAAKTVTQWKCDLDLHQGDTGTLTFERTNGAIAGETVVRDGSSRHAISGTWSGEPIQFTRRLSGTSIQLFKGVAVATDDGRVRMGGRFTFRYAGVWSADCREVEKTATINPTRRRVVQPGRVAIQPSRVATAQPAQTDRGKTADRVLLDLRTGGGGPGRRGGHLLRPPLRPGQ